MFLQNIYFYILRMNYHVIKQIEKWSLAKLRLKWHIVTYDVLKKGHWVYALAKYIFLYTSHELPFDKNLFQISEPPGDRPWHHLIVRRQSISNREWQSISTRVAIDQPSSGNRPALEWRSTSNQVEAIETDMWCLSFSNRVVPSCDQLWKHFDSILQMSNRNPKQNRQSSGNNRDRPCCHSITNRSAIKWQRSSGNRSASFRE